VLEKVNAMPRLSSQFYGATFNPELSKSIPEKKKFAGRPTVDEAAVKCLTPTVSDCVCAAAVLLLSQQL
jgi:hypothetical protein